MYKRKTKLSPIHISLIALAILVVIAVIVTFAAGAWLQRMPDLPGSGSII